MRTFFAMIALTALTWAEENAAPRVEAIGARVAKGHELKERLVWPTGTSVLLQVTSKIGEFTRLDALGSKLSKVTDDLGNNLLPEVKGAVPFGEVIGINPRFEIDESRKVCVVEAATPQLPAIGAKSVTFSGMLLMECASKKTETVLPNVALRNGVRLTGPGKIALTIEQLGPPQYGKEPLEFILRSERDLSDVAEIKFFKPDGNEFASKRTSTSSTTIEGSTKVEWTYVLAEKTERATVKLYTWSDANKKKIDFEVKVNLGL